MSAVSISVVVRLRPFNSREKGYKSKLCIEMPDSNTVCMIDPKSSTIQTPPRKFQFDHALWTHDRGTEDSPRDFADQLKTYEVTGKPLLENAFMGFNSCLFAYGQTGSGKSYSVMGAPEDRGIIPQLCDDLFKKAAAISEHTSVAVECSYLEIYNEQVKDLLNPAGLDKVLKVRQHPQLGVFVEGLKKMTARSAEEIAKYVDDGTQVRTIASTNMNATSSRSHAILTLNIRVKSTETETMSVLHLVDLAGSERAASTGAEGATLKEGANINKSLSVLGMCLSRLADQCAEGAKKALHIPFRDSQLTWLLHDALGGNSKTTMLAAISPADINLEETLSTLRFASITKKIKMVVKINEDPQQKIIRELREQILALKDEIKALAEGRMVQRPMPKPQPYTEEQQPMMESDAMAVDALPEVSVDVRRAQLLEELEQNTNLMVEWAMTAEQREARDEVDRVAHERQMEELKRGSGGAGSKVEETSPKLLVLNEDLRMLRGPDGNPLPLVHTMVCKELMRSRSQEGGGGSHGGSPDNSLLPARGRLVPALGGCGSRSYSTFEPPQVYTAVGPIAPVPTAASSASAASGVKKPINLDDDDEPDPQQQQVWMRLPAASGLSPAMRLDFIVDFQERTLSLEFHEEGKSSGDVVFVNGKPIRLAADDTMSTSVGGGSSSRCCSTTLVHNDRVIVGQVVFRVFEPLVWRAAALGGEDETFQPVAKSSLEHHELLETYHRLNIEEEAYESLVTAVFGDDSDDSIAASSPASRGSAANLLQTGAAADAPISVNAAQVRCTLESFSSVCRFSRAETEEELIGRFPRDVKRDLRAQDIQDALSIDCQSALTERQMYFQEKQQEQEQVQRRLKDLEAENEKLVKEMEEQERQRDEAAKKAKDMADRAALEQVARAEEMAKQKLEIAAKTAGNSAGPMTVATMKQTAQGKLATARKVHEYEELRRELLLWKPAGPTDPRDRPAYQAFSTAISSGKNVPSYIAIRGMFQGIAAASVSGNDKTMAVLAAATSLPDDLLLPLFDGQVFKNRIKTGFFSRGGLHPVTMTVLHHYLFYFEAGAALKPATAANLTMVGFAYLLGCEMQILPELEKKPALRVVSCAPRKETQGKTDPHHPLEFAFTSIEQRDAAVRAINSVRLPAPDPDVAAALAQLDG